MDDIINSYFVPVTFVRSEIARTIKGYELEICRYQHSETIPFLSVFSRAQQYSDHPDARPFVFSMRLDGTRLIIFDHESFLLTTTGG